MQRQFQFILLAATIAATCLSPKVLGGTTSGNNDKFQNDALYNNTSNVDSSSPRSSVLEIETIPVLEKKEEVISVLSESTPVDSGFDGTQHTLMLVPLSSAPAAPVESTIISENDIPMEAVATENDGVIALEVAESRISKGRRYIQSSANRPYRPQYYGYARPQPSYYNYYYGRPRPFNRWNSYNNPPLLGFSIQG